jgi:thiamine-monophosphate kinase
MHREGTVGALGEDALIELFAKDTGLPSSHLIVPNGDDAAAYVTEAPYASVITTDALVEGVHFDLSFTTPPELGRKLIAVNLSDLAAMGARPKYVLLAIAMAPSVAVEVAAGIATGVRDQCRAYGMLLIGGNTSKTSGPMVLTATLIGRVLPEEVIRRRGTLVGDALFVTGTLGDANAGLRVAKAGVPKTDDPRFALVSALVEPVARVEAGRALAKSRLVHAMCDVSDGLGRDLGRLLVPEGLGAHVDAHLLPISPSLRAYAREVGESAELIALEGGEDYELLFTADPDDGEALFEALRQASTPVTRIGTVTASREIEIFMSDGIVIGPPDGYDHFRGGR